MFLLWRNGHERRVHTRTMKIEDMRAPRLRASVLHGRAVPCFLKMLPVIDPPRGRPFLVRRRSSQIIENVNNPQITLVIAIFMGKPRFLYDAPLLNQPCPVGGRGALGYNDSDLLEIV